MDMIIIVPARSGSNRLPGKNVRAFEIGKDGLPHNLVERTILQAMSLNSTIIVSSDISPRKLFGRIVSPDTNFTDKPTEYVFKYCLDKFYFVDRAQKRWLNKPETRTEEVVEDVLEEYETESFCLLQPTSPIRDIGVLLKAQRSFVAGNLPALISVGPDFQPNGNFYFVRTKDFLEQKTVYVRNASFYVCKGAMNIDVDSIFNFRIAQAVVEKGIYGDYENGFE